MIHPIYSYPSEHTLPRTILLVEDEPFVRDATCRILSNAGFEVLPVADAEEAFELYAKNGQRVDLLITDLVLPGRSGRQLVQDLRRSSPAILALLTSGYPEPECDTGPPEAHTYYLAKPYSRATLIEKIEQVLGVSPQGRAAAKAG